MSIKQHRRRMWIRAALRKQARHQRAFPLEHIMCEHDEKQGECQSCKALEEANHRLADEVAGLKQENSWLRSGLRERHELHATEK